MIERTRCTATSKATGQPCGNLAIPGGTVCRFHGGSSKKVKAAAARRLALGEAKGELERLGVPIDVEPAEAMLAMVAEAAGNVAFLRRRVQELDQLLGGYDGNDALQALAVLGSSKGEWREIEAGPPAIAGRIDPHNWRAERHVLVAMYDDERERLVRWSKACRDAGVEERRVVLAEEQGRQLASVLRGTIAALLALVVRLVESGPVSVEAVRQAWSNDVPGIVRAQIAAVTSGGGSS